MTHRVVFEQGILSVFDETDRKILEQPFRPTSSGEYIPWNNEEEATKWWQSVSNNHVQTVAEDNNQENSSSEENSADNPI